ncbi:zinc-binding dehydrogenase [Kribbella sp. NBC_01245]|uniref:alcohol dehydrogenase catalytic domain-containing protein n=1 Tax=Kribbella sp. NBC_01245 TaxID=2903578 RepID=UPI002E2E0C33|nr:zinc-binding dehydrogenase [Kribbella sp. NBC_01245]
MRAAWYDEQGPAADVLQVGEVADPVAGPGEVRVRVAFSAVHVGDIGKRRGWWGSTMTFPRVIPHGDGAGVIDQVGEGVDPGRVGERVWVYLAQSYRPFGTAAEFTVVPADRAVPVPADVADVPEALKLGADRALAVDEADQAELAKKIGPVDRIAEVAFDGNLALDVEILRYGGSIATYATRDPQPAIPYWELAFKNIRVEFLSNEDFPAEANEQAVADLTEAVAAGDLLYPIAARLPLDQIAQAHDLTELAPSGHRVLIEVTK